MPAPGPATQHTRAQPAGSGLPARPAARQCTAPHRPEPNTLMPQPCCHPPAAAPNPPWGPAGRAQAGVQSCPCGGPDPGGPPPGWQPRRCKGWWRHQRPAGGARAGAGRPGGQAGRQAGRRATVQAAAPVEPALPAPAPRGETSSTSITHTPSRHHPWQPLPPVPRPSPSHRQQPPAGPSSPQQPAPPPPHLVLQVRVGAGRAHHPQRRLPVLIAPDPARAAGPAFQRPAFQRPACWWPGTPLHGAGRPCCCRRCCPASRQGGWCRWCSWRCLGRDARQPSGPGTRSLVGAAPGGGRQPLVADSAGRCEGEQARQVVQDACGQEGRRGAAGWAGGRRAQRRGVQHA
jgi:hypothetical protein